MLSLKKRCNFEIRIIYCFLLKYCFNFKALSIFGLGVFLKIRAYFNAFTLSIVIIWLLSITLTVGGSEKI